MLIKREFKTSVVDTRAYRGADVASDHYLVRTKLRLKLNKIQTRNRLKPKLDVHKLEWEDIRQRYNVEVRTRFEALDIEGDVNEHAEEIEKAYVEAAGKVLGFVRNRSKPWIGGETWQKIEVRKVVKQKIESTRSERVKLRLRKEYRVKGKAVKYS